MTTKDVCNYCTNTVIDFLSVRPSEENQYFCTEIFFVILALKTLGSVAFS